MDFFFFACWAVVDRLSQSVVGRLAVPRSAYRRLPKAYYRALHCLWCCLVSRTNWLQRGLSMRAVLGR